MILEYGAGKQEKVLKVAKAVVVVSGGVGAASPHVEGAERPDSPGPETSGTGTFAARRAEAPPGRAPHGGRKSAVDSPHIFSKDVLSPEVGEGPARRQFTAAYKLRILAEADAAKAEGELGTLLRREGLYRSRLSDWRAQVADGSLAALAPRKRGRKAEEVSPLVGQVAGLQRDKRWLEARVKQLELLIDVQKKIVDLLGTVPPVLESEEER